MEDEDRLNERGKEPLRGKNQIQNLKKNHGKKNLDWNSLDFALLLKKINHAVRNLIY